MKSDALNAAALLELGQRPVTRCNLIGKAPFSEDPETLTRPYLTPAHAQALERLKAWMVSAGMSVRIDPVGNLIGRYEGAKPNAPALLIGSHIDTVSNAGRYDGPLGIMLGIECVEALAKKARRFPFAIEVIAFGDEEGSRFPISMMCSRAIASEMDNDKLQLSDSKGISLREALKDFGLDPEDVGQAVRPASDFVGYIEAHIEQGPILEEERLPIGVVTGISAQLRLKARFIGEAGHAGTVPMHLRRDALIAAAEGILSVERVCAKGPRDLVGTVGSVQSSTAAFNVIARQAEISIDLRSASVAVRDAAATEIENQLRAIAAARGVSLEFSVLQDLPACPCDKKLTALMHDAVHAVGVRPFHLSSGAGHDAMSLARITNVAMLFIRCEKGISHSALEKVNAADVAYATRALIEFIERLGRSLA